MYYELDPMWRGAIAVPANDGWRGLTVWDVALLPHPLSLGAEVWRLLQQGGRGRCFEELFRHRMGPVQETSSGCDKLCQPDAARWVYVLGDHGMTVLTTVCFTEGPGLVSPPHHLRHVVLEHFLYRGMEPDWMALIEQMLRLKTGAKACPKQRIAA